MPEISNFDVLKTMCERNLNCGLAPIGENLLQAQAGKRGTRITLGWPGNVVSQLMSGKYVGGLILADRQQFDQVKAELERDRIQRMAEIPHVLDDSEAW